MALLVVRLEASLNAAGDGPLAQSLEVTHTLAHDLFEKICVIEQVSANNGELNDMLTRVDVRLEQSLARIEGLEAQLNAIKPPKKLDLDSPSKTSGSIIGDAVRDSFLNLGG